MSARLPVVFALVLGLGLGFGLGSTLSTRSAPTHAASETLVQRAAPADEEETTAAVPLEPLTALAPTAASSAADERLQERASEASSGVGARVRATIDSSVTLGTQRISGTVVDAEGRPLAGATVLASPTNRGSARPLTGTDTENVGRAWSGRSIDDVLEQHARSVLERWDRTTTAKAGAGGSFALTGLADGQHSLTAFHEGYTFESVLVTGASDAKIVGRRVGAFRLDVRLPDGTAPESAVVTVERPQGRSEVLQWSGLERPVRVSGRSMTFRVLAGNVRSTGRAGLSSDLVSREIQIDLDRDGDGPHAVELAPRSHLRVTLENAGGTVNRAARPWVKVIPAVHIGAQRERALRRAESLRSGFDGVFHTMDLAPGDYLVAAGRGGEKVEASEIVVVDQGLNDVLLRFEERDASKVLIVRCAGPDGSPPKRVQFRGSIKNAGFPRPTFLRPSERGAGEYWIDRSELVSDEPWVETSEVKLTATATGLGSVAVPVALGQESVDIRFQPTCSIDVRVVGDVSGGFTVAVSPVSDDASPASALRGTQAVYADVDPDGTARVEGLQPGRVRVGLKRVGKRTRLDAALTTVDASLTSGTTSLTLTLPSLHEVAIHAPDLDVGTRIYLQDAKEADTPTSFVRARNGSLGADRRLVFEDVPAGDYVIRPLGPRMETMRITVPCGEVEFTADVVDAFRVGTVTPDGLGAASGLREGDIVDELAGRLVEGHNFHQRLAVALESSAVTLTIERGGSTIEVSVGPTAAGSSATAQLGVMFLPRSRPR
ncbi:MAG: hypothetical protein AAGI22_00135 [Planctomycetota bacterium]